MYKPYLQFESPGTTYSCIRKITYISKLQDIPDEEEDYSYHSYCIVKTADEFFNGRPLEGRKAEKMIAFGACASYLQNVDYVNNEIVLSWFVNRKNQSVIFAFSEIDRKQSQTIGGSYVAEYDENFVARHSPLANRREEGYSGTLYFGRKYYPETEHSLRGWRGDWQTRTYTVAQLIKEFLELKNNEAIDLAKITKYGDYRTYKWFIIRKDDIKLLIDVLELNELGDLLYERYNE